MCIDIEEIWFGIANGQISSTFNRDICLLHNSGGVLLFHLFILKKVSEILKKIMFKSSEANSAVVKLVLLARLYESTASVSVSVLASAWCWRQRWSKFLKHYIS